MSGRPQIRRVLQVHTSYRQAGGEDQVVAAERLLLEEAGIKVEQVLFGNAELRESRSLAGDLRLATGAVWSRSAERRVGAALAAHRPQVMHVHNTFAAASPSVYAAASAHGVPVVQSLHNYRFVCPAATAFRDGHPCTDCVGRRLPWPAVIHSCIRGSRAQSVVAATTLGVHRALGTFDRGIDTYVAGTSFQRQLMVDGGLPAEHIRVVPNFLEPDPGAGRGRRTGVVYVGRLAEEKGIATLLQAAEFIPGSVTVVGDGPLAPRVHEAAAAGHVKYLGPLWSDEMREQLRGAAALAVPSIWFEGFPMVVVEAYAAGTPVIASRIGSLAAIVEDGVTGLLVAPGDTDRLGERFAWAIDHPQELAGLGVRARQRYEMRYRGAAHLEALLDIYQTSIARRRRAASV
jgi:glycosyltransferase involved in cell wall biosynthesis